jgi:hypothetical protein
VPQLALSVALFVVAPPSRISDVVRDPSHWGRWWPDLVLTVTEDRGERGMRWEVSGAVVGSAELWVEPVMDGAVLHWYLRGDARLGPAGRETSRRRAEWLRAAISLKAQLEAGRRPGVKPTADGADE